MMILDTNVVSELTRRHPEPAVQAWTEGFRSDEFVTTSITVMELRAGVERMQPGRRQRELSEDVEWILGTVLGNRILNFDRKAAYAAAAWFAKCARDGRTIETRDTQIAGIAVSRRIPVVTRNLDHFEGLDVNVINPWPRPG